VPGRTLDAHGVLQLDASRAFSRFDAVKIIRRASANFNAGAECAWPGEGSLLPTCACSPIHPAAGRIEGRPVTGQGRLRYENRH